MHLSLVQAIETYINFTWKAREKEKDFNLKYIYIYLYKYLLLWWNCNPYLASTNPKQSVRVAGIRTCARRAKEA